MSITAEGMTKALFILDACNLNAAKQGQARVWAEVIREAQPTATDDDVIAAVKVIAKQRNADARGGTWVTPGDLIAVMRDRRNRAIEAQRSREARELESAPVDPEHVQRLIAMVRAAVKECA